MNRVTEPFGAVPRRLADDLYAGELSWDEFAVLAWLELRVNYRVSPPIWRGTTAGMAEAMRWPHSPKHLGKVLRALQTRGWIESTAQPRSPKPYTVRLLRGAALREGLEPDWIETGSGSGHVGSQSPAPRSQSRGGSNPHSEGVCGSPVLEAGASPQKQKPEHRVHGSDSLHAVHVDLEDSETGRLPRNGEPGWEAPEARPAPGPQPLESMTRDELHRLAWEEPETREAIKAEMERRAEAERRFPPFHVDGRTGGADIGDDEASQLRWRRANPTKARSRHKA